MILFTVNNNIDILDIFTLVISVIAFTATLRKKEFGTFYYINKSEEKSDIWIKLIKSDMYNLKLTCEPYSNMKLTIVVYDPEKDKESVLAFANEDKPIVEAAEIKENSIVKFRNCKTSSIHIEYKDRYNNHYCQKLKQQKINTRIHKNFWNLTFVGT